MKSQLLQQQRALKAQAQEALSHKSTPNSYLSNMQYIPEGAQVRFHPPQLMQENQTSAANVFASLLRQYDTILTYRCGSSQWGDCSRLGRCRNTLLM